MRNHAQNFHKIYVNKRTREVIQGTDNNFNGFQELLSQIQKPLSID